MRASDQIYEELLKALSVQGPAPKAEVKELTMRLHLAHVTEKVAMVDDFKADLSQAIRQTADLVVEGLTKTAK